MNERDLDLNGDGFSGRSDGGRMIIRKTWLRSFRSNLGYRSKDICVYTSIPFDVLRAVRSLDDAESYSNPHPVPGEAAFLLAFMPCHKIASDLRHSLIFNLNSRRRDVELVSVEGGDSNVQITRSANSVDG